MDFDDILGEHPSIAIGVAGLALLYWLGCRLCGRRPTRSQVGWFTAALVVILYTHTGLDEYADDRIFFMHMLVQAFIIPPMLLLGVPGWMLRPWVMSRPIKPIARVFTNPVVAFSLFSAIFVTAHFPPIFDLMCRNENFHIFLHLCFMASGVLLWWPILSPMSELPRLPYPAQILYVFLLMIPMTAVAAPITLATHVIYPWYLEGPHGWGIKPLDDQILGGLMMWVGQGTYLTAVFTVIFYRWSREEDRDEPMVTTAPPASRPHLRALPPRARA
ncbi:MAG: cytochrome c oxidase assembly protein [Candidatus Binataceae bacterium]